MFQNLSHEEFLQALEGGQIRVSEKKNDSWEFNPAVKERILDIFRHTAVIPMGDYFCDKEPLAPRQMSAHCKQKHIRIVPGGSAVRAGVFLGNGVIVMPPSYINVGAFVDSETMIDSHVLVGSCAHIGKKNHISAGVIIGGVLEPVTHRPVIIEDNCFIGAGCIVVEGMLIRTGAVLAPGVRLSASITVYDTVHNCQIKGEIPENAVVIPGTRSLEKGSIEGLATSCAIIIKYRDEKTNAAVALEECLR